MRSILINLFALSLVLFTGSASSKDFTTRVAMLEKSAETFYVPGEIPGYGSVELMVDTGSGYMTINEQTLEVLKRESRVRFIKQLEAVLADGSLLIVPVYSIGYMSIGQECWIENVEAAVFPGESRLILGLSALRKTSPFIFSVDPPALLLSRCGRMPVAEPKADS